MPRSRRRLTVIAALDMVGYSELMQRDEIGTLAESRAIYRTLVRPSLRRHEGHVIKLLGDGGLLEFPSVLDAVEWCMAFQTAMAERKPAPGLPTIEVRAAIALADVILSDDDRYGAAIGFAMRLQAAAPPGGIAITHSVRWQLLGECAAAFKAVGFLMLRSVPYPVEAWFWMPPGRTVPDAQPSLNQMLTPGVLALPGLAAGPQEDQRPLLAVLPFEDLSSDHSCGAIAQGLVEETNTMLGHMRSIRVVARSSAARVRGGAADLRTGGELPARYAIEGSVRRSGGRLRVAAQLIDVETGTLLWSGRQDGALDDPFALEDAAAMQIAGASHSALRAAEIERVRRKGPDTLRAHDLVLKAMPHFWAHRREDNAIAIRLLDEAMTIEPRSAQAMGLKAWCLSQEITYLWSDDSERDKHLALMLAERAAASAEADALVYTMVGATHSILTVDQTRARAFVERALGLDPSFAWAWTRLGFVQAYSHQPREGLESLNRSIALSPDDPIRFNASAGLATCHFLLGDYAEAARHARHAIDARPGMIWANRLLATAAALAGELDLAHEAVQRLLEERPGMTIGEIRRGVHNLGGADLDQYLGGLRLAGLPDA